MSKKIKLTVEHENGTNEFERELVFFVAMDEKDGEIDADSGIVGSGGSFYIGEVIAKAILQHPNGKKIIAALLLTLGVLKGAEE